LTPIRIVRSETFDRWMKGLNDKRGAARIQLRLDRLAYGNPGDAKPVGSGVSELKVDVGPGYRVYCQQHGDVLILLLCGGDKSTQKKDIEKAHEIAKEWKDHG
jgi:putative addiction module killer protein